MLHIDEFNEYLHETYRHLRRQTSTAGPVDHRSLVEEQMRKIHG